MSGASDRVSGATLRGRLAGALAVAAFATVASSATVQPAGPSVDIRLSGSSEQIVMQCAFGEYRTRTVTVAGESFQELELAGEALTMEAGAPRLPKVCRSVIIPDDAKMAVRVLAADYYEVPSRIAPAQGSLPRSIDPADVPRSFGRVYQADAFWPGELARLGEPYILRDYRGVVVELYPFQYNPVTRVLRVYTAVTVEVAAIGPGQVNVLKRTRPDRKPSRAFHQIYERRFVNYGGDGRYPPLDEDGDLLIIAHDPWIPTLTPLAAHKNGIGIDTTVVGVSTIGNDATAIKDYIRGVYDTSDLAFVLLVGDIQQVSTPYAWGAPSDPSYAKLAGDDDYPDIMVGRFSAQMSPHVDTQVQRTIEYEANQATQQEWFWRGSGIGSDPTHLDNLRDLLLAHGYTHVDRIYDPNATSAAISAALNEGRGMVNYAGYGGSTFWGTGSFFNADIETLVNSDMLPFIFSVASLNGNFAVETCFAEAWLRATVGSEPTGAVATYMASDHQYWLEPLTAQNEFVNLYVSEAYTSFGTLCFAGACRMLDEYGATGAMMFDTWIVFGDPSLRVVGTIPNPSVRYVDDDAPLGGDGRSWQTAYKYVQDALHEAVHNLDITEIRVAGGTYKPDQDEGGHVTLGDPAASFYLRWTDFAVRGGYRGLAGGGDPDDRDIAAFPSVLSGDLDGDDQPGFVNYDDNSCHVVYADVSEGTVVLDGFTITGGNAENAEYPDSTMGGGMFNYGFARPTVRSCAFVRNRATHGGGLGNLIFGGGPIRITDCVFVDNLATEYGGGLAGGGSHVMARCVFIGNSANAGGGLFAGRAGSLTVANSTFLGNEASENGGGLYLWQCSRDVRVTNCLLSGNRAGANGGGLHEDYLLDLVLANNTITGNTADGIGGGVYFQTHDRNPRLVNCILWGNSDGNGVGESSQFSSDVINDRTLAYNCVQGWSGGFGGVGNTGNDPLFADPDGPDNDPNTWEDNDYHLAPGSPCIDAGCNCGLPRDAADLDGDGDADEITPLDLDSEGRFFDDPTTPDTGNGLPVIVDMGTYEFGGTGPQPCIGDLNDDGQVNLSDIATVLASYGTTTGMTYANGDLDCDGDVDLSDLAALLAVYGTNCP